MMKAANPLRGLFPALLIASALALPACVELPGSKTKPPRLYVLSPKSTFSDKLRAVRWQLLVDTPVAPAGLSTARIAMQDSPYELRYFQDANWTDFAPQMVQSLIIESFENSNRIISVGREQIGLRSDFQLKSELREFQAEYDRQMPPDTTSLGPKEVPPWARVRINVKLVKMPQREIVATQTFERRLPAKANTMADIIEAFDTALGKVLKSMVTWTLKTGAAHQRKHRPSG
jgi:cholesterol transport system auxiliary component